MESLQNKQKGMQSNLSMHDGILKAMLTRTAGSDMLEHKSSSYFRFNFLTVNNRITLDVLKANCIK